MTDQEIQSPQAHDVRFTVLLTQDQQHALEQLCDRRRAQAPGHRITASDVVRELIIQAASLTT